jgi:hypothetical protein
LRAVLSLLLQWLLEFPDGIVCRILTQDTFVSSCFPKYKANLIIGGNTFSGLYITKSLPGTTQPDCISRVLKARLIPSSVARQIHLGIQPFSMVVELL